MIFKKSNKKIGRNSRDISYVGKDFADFRKNLIDYTKTYFPETYNDFNETSPGMMFVELASYVGDVLSYYTDSSLKESFIQFATDDANLFALAEMLGYKPKVTSPAVTTLSVYQLCKATFQGELDTRYLLRIKEGLVVSSTSRPDVRFRTLEDLDFNDITDREISVFNVDAVTGLPDFFLVKKFIQAISAEEKTTQFNFTTPEAFSSVRLGDDSNVIGIESVTDTNGNRWYEVPYLAQEMVYIDYPNVPEYDEELSAFKETVPYILKLLKTSRRFVVRVDVDFGTSLVFGGGDSSLSDELLIPNIKNVGIGLNSSIDRMEESYDSTNFLRTKSYGQSPGNTTLTVKYLVGGGVSSNVPQGDLTSMRSISFNDDEVGSTVGLDQTVYNYVKGSVAVENEIPARGGRGSDTIEEIRYNALANFASQNRAVTAQDYQIRSLAMPTKYGSVAKIYAIADNKLNTNSPETLLNSTDTLFEFTEIVKSILTQAETEERSLTSEEIKDSIRDFVTRNENSGELVNPFAINLYTLGLTSEGYLSPLNKAAKENLKTYINEYRILTDGVNILNGFIINIGINFDITIYRNYNSREVVLNCIEQIKEEFSIDKWQFNQPIYISDIEVMLSNIDGVASVQKVEIVNKCGGAYSKNSYDIAAATKGKIIYPSLDPSIFELKFPEKDIKGRAI